MIDRSFLDWPFFGPQHRQVHADLESWAQEHREGVLDDRDESQAGVAAGTRRIVAALGEAGFLTHSVGGLPAGSGIPDARMLCLIREVLARNSGLADFVFAMQGLGTGPISLFGNADQKQRYQPMVASGRWVAAFALSEADAGSDVAAMTCRAERHGSGWLLTGAKAWISNAGLADFYTVFARSGEAAGSKGISAFIVDADNPGLQISKRLDIIAPHPIGTIILDNCLVDASAIIGAPGEGFRIAMATLDLFRPTVGAAALGFARAALELAGSHAQQRRLYGGLLSDLHTVRARLADMALATDAAALLVYRAAWTKDEQKRRISREASMAKLFATEQAQKVIDGAVQLLGGRGVVRGAHAERLYRDIRAMRIYEGASEVQQMIIADSILRGGAAEGRTVA